MIISPRAYLRRRATYNIRSTLTGIKLYHLIGSDDYWSDPAWRDHATLPPLVIERMNRAALLPLLRSFWLAFGLERPANPFGGDR